MPFVTATCVTASASTHALDVASHTLTVMLVSGAQ
jgi:hypothetical protein